MVIVIFSYIGCLSLFIDFKGIRPYRRQSWRGTELSKRFIHGCRRDAAENTKIPHKRRCNRGQNEKESVAATAKNKKGVALYRSDRAD